MIFIQNVLIKKDWYAKEPVGFDLFFSDVLSVSSFLFATFVLSAFVLFTITTKYPKSDFIDEAKFIAATMIYLWWSFHWSQIDLAIIWHAELYIADNASNIFID